MSKQPKNPIDIDPITAVFIISALIFLPLLFAGFLFQ